jgi:hypothetical protein
MYLEKLIVAQRVTEISALYGTGNDVAFFIESCH